MNKPKILFIDDDEMLALFVKEFLAHYDISVAANAGEATRLMNSIVFDLVVLDLGLPDEDGLVLLRKWRYSRTIPIIVISSRTDEETRVAVLELGAADYLSKPFIPREFQLRVQRLLPQEFNSEFNTKANISLIVLSEQPYLALDLKRHELLSNDNVGFNLTRAEFDILAALAKQFGGVIKRNELLDVISYKGKDVNPNSLGVLIHRIRKKLGNALGNTLGSEVMITTIPNIGYRLELPHTKSNIPE